MKNPGEEDTREHLEGIEDRGKGINEISETRKSTRHSGNFKQFSVTKPTVR